MSSPPRSSHLDQLLLPLALIILMAFAVIAFRFYTYEFHAESIDEVLLPVSPEPSKAAFNSIGVGMVAGNLYNFDAGKKTFDADGWIWITWSPEADQQMKRKSLTPRDLFFFYNGVNDYDFSILPDTVSPLRMANGRYYQKYQFSGHFYVNDLNLRLYPFQTITLPIAFELKSFPLWDDGTALNLVLDHEHSGVGSYVEVSGYINKGFKFSNVIHQYQSSHAEPGLIGDIRSLLQARMEVSYVRAPMATMIKLIMPLFSVMVILLLSPMIPSTGWDVRVAIPPTVMLTLIFLQQNYQANLPELPYITFMDCLYNTSYLDCMMLFVLYIWGSMRYHFASDEERRETIIKIHRIDRWVLLALVVIFPIEAWINWNAMSLPWH